MSQEEQLEFQCDPTTLNWDKFLHDYMMGIGIWVLLEDHISPEHGLEQIVIKQKLGGEDY